VQALRFPDRTTPIGKMINAYLTNAAEMDDHALHLLFSANRWEARHQIESLLTSGVSVVVDRYAYSGVAFSAAKGLDLDWCKKPDVGLPAPDVVIYMHLAIEDAVKRGDFGAERYEKVDFQRSVQDVFKKLQQPGWKVVDANQTVEDVHAQLKAIALEAISAHGETPIARISY